MNGIRNYISFMLPFDTTQVFLQLRCPMSQRINHNLSGRGSRSW